MAQAIELAVVIPTLNERNNVETLIGRLEDVLRGICFEIIYVDDDSPDGTADLVREIGQRKPWVRVVQRIGRRGLASACMEGMLATSAPYLAVMDADLQHDESILPDMLARLRSGEFDIAIGSRNTEGGSMGEFARNRVALSRLGHRISRLVSHHSLSDPMSGYFMLTRAFLNETMRSTTNVGFKVLLDLVSSSKRPVRTTEIGYRFRNRAVGTSKLDTNTGIEYLYLVIDKAVGRYIPIRFVLYCMVGVVGLAIHLAILWLLYRRAGYSLETALIPAIGVAIVGNYAFNNQFTYRERRRRGLRFLTGLLSFAAVCSIGAMANYALAASMTASGVWWPIASACGLAIGSVWNFAANEIVTWHAHRRR